MEQQDLKGKAAIVTGSSSGIGASVAMALARRGAGVTINYSKSAKEADAVAAEIAQAGGKAHVAQGNVAEDADCRRIAAETVSAFGRVDILVNNAGTTKFAGHRDLDALSSADFAGIYAVNVIGAFQMIRACVDHLRKSDDGAVVNVSSIAGIEGLGSSVAYAASKGALNTMTLSLARALAPEIRVNAVAPGFVDSPWNKDWPADRKVASIERTPLKRACTPHDIAETAFFLCAGNSMITGQTIIVDGGLTL
jgi:3-oxoacyl-[acyl-carrier protein] reductase